MLESTGNDVQRGRPNKAKWLFLFNNRRLKDLTQEELARRSGLWQNQIGEFERGIRPPSLEQMSAIAQVLEIPINKISEEAELFFIKR